jgi:hypothetical protein
MTSPDPDRTPTLVPPLEATRRRLARTFRLFTFELAPTPDEPWVSITDASDPARLADRVAQLSVRYADQRDVAAAYIAMRIAGVVAGPLIGTYLLERRVPLLDPDTAHVRTDRALEFSRLATGTTRFAALASDIDAGHPDMHVVTHDVLIDTVVESLDRLVAPLLTALRPLAPFGRRGLWGLIADSVGGGALASARETGADHRPAWAEATEILDRLQDRGLPVANRPRPLVVTCDGHEIPFNIRGTCCLRYKADEPRDHHDPEFGGYCHSCPLIDDAVLERHYLDTARARLTRSRQ